MTSEIKKRLGEQYKFKIEMHAHTRPASPCGEATPTELAKIYAEQGYDAVVLSNHYSYTYSKFTSAGVKTPEKEQFIEEYLKDFDEFAVECEKLGIKAILAAEARFNENINDYLIYGVDKDVLRSVYDYFDKGVTAFRTEVKLDRSVFIQAHPFRNNMTQVDASLLDGIEVFNMHPGHNSRIGIASKYTKQNNLQIKTAGSDFHHKDVGHEGVSALRTKFLPSDTFELAEILKSGDYLLEIGGDSLILP